MKAEATLQLAEIEVKRQTELVQKAARHRRGSTRPSRGAARPRARCWPPRRTWRRPSFNSATPTSRRRSPAGSAGRMYRSAITSTPVDRGVGDDREPGSDLRQLSGDPARAARDCARTASDNRGDYSVLSAARRRQPLRQGRQGRLPRGHGEPGNRHRSGPCGLSESRSHPDRRAAGQRGGGSRQERQGVAGPAAGSAGRPERRFRPGCRQGQQGGGAPRRSRRSPRRAYRGHEGAERGRARHHRGHPEGAAGQVVQPTEVKPVG